MRLFLASWALVALVSGQTFMAQLQAEHDPKRRADKALVFADQSFDSAKAAYGKGEIHNGDGELDDMITALNTCVSSATQAKNPKLFKKAELHVAYLQRRMRSLVESLSTGDRGWAEFTDRKLEDIHEKLLEGVMRK